MEHERRRERAQAMGGHDKLARRQTAGVLNARERISRLVDPGSWEEVGLFAVAAEIVHREQTPADGKITGFARVGGREVGVVAYDFTVKGSSSGAVGERKVAYMKQSATRGRMPIIFLGESTGARMPDIMGAEGMAALDGRTRFLRVRETPWVSAVLGNAFGSAAWHACAADFNVIRKGSVMAVSSPLLIHYATGETVDPEDVGGWRLHAEVTGFADSVADSDIEAIDYLRRFLGYLPSNHGEPPPRVPVPAGKHQDAALLSEVIPEVSAHVYDMRKVIDLIADSESVLELKPYFGTSLTTALARVDGRTVGFLANNPRFKGGAVDSDACDKATDFLVLCDSFNVPLVFLVDQPGFLVGLNAERRRIAGKVVNWMNALSLVTVPRIMVIIRKSYGQAYINMGGGGTSDVSAAWWTADVSFMDPRAAAAIVAGSDRQDDTRRRAELAETMTKDTSAYALAEVFGVQDVIDPLETRNYLIRQLEIHAGSGRAVGRHLLSSWPTSY